jgi:hypothetical protein
VCECNVGSLYNPSRKICESLDLYVPGILHH